MAILKCKMCGGTLEVHNNESVAECEYCGSKQTIPTNNDDVITNLFNRANNLRLKCEFDKAAQIYEKIIEKDESEAEAHWGIVLCKYGIEYVEDPQTMQRIPTCHRTLFDAITKDVDYIAAIDYSDTLQQTIYEKEARAIDKIQKDILTIVNNEKPFDVFICYKESDENGKRTVDSTIANDIYYQLTQEGFKVFYAAITLEDKLGQEYEPYIFAALNSAKVMLVLGTKPEYFNAVWVKNEWSRFMGFMKTDRSKLLIPCYRDMDAYDLPEEFAHLQAQNMSKLGFMQDLIRGIKKITQTEQPIATVVKETIVSNNNTNTTPLLKRAFMFLEDKEWDLANEYCEKVLDIDPECAEAYLGKLMVELNVSSQQNLKNCLEPFSKRNNFQKVMRFADDNLQSELQGYIDYIVNRNLENAYKSAVHMMHIANAEEDYKKVAREFQKLQEYKDSKNLCQECLDKAKDARLTVLYKEAKSLMYNAEDEYAYKIAAERFSAIKTFKDAAEKEKLCLEKAEASRKDEIYNFANFLMQDKTIASYRHAIEVLETIVEWKDSSSKIGECERGIQEVQQREEAEQVEKVRIAECERVERERQEETARQEAERLAKRKKRNATLLISIVCIVIAFILILNNVIIPNRKYHDAKALMDAGNFDEACKIFVALGDYKDSADMANTAYYNHEIEKIKVSKVGDYVFWGAYEQDNNTLNGKENLEWLILEVKDGKVLLLSRYAIDCKKYNTTHNDVTWETCTLRKWLNTDFIESAFFDEEKAMITTTKVLADKNHECGTDPGNETMDQIFLLSIKEATKYISTDSARQCYPTDYAVTNGVHNGYDDLCIWWLRSPGRERDCAAYVYANGEIIENGAAHSLGEAVDWEGVGVRPAMWIKLNN